MGSPAHGGHRLRSVAPGSQTANAARLGISGGRRRPADSGSRPAGVARVGIAPRAGGGVMAIDRWKGAYLGPRAEDRMSAPPQSPAVPRAPREPRGARRRPLGKSGPCAVVFTATSAEPSSQSASTIRASTHPDGLDASDAVAGPPDRPTAGVGVRSALGDGARGRHPPPHADHGDEDGGALVPYTRYHPLPPAGPMPTRPACNSMPIFILQSCAMVRLSLQTGPQDAFEAMASPTYPHGFAVPGAPAGVWA
jgi:hypothetical protein